MSRIFDNEVCDLNINFETDNSYAKNYNNWRQKEEFNRLKTKYGEDILNTNDNDSSSSSDDDEDGVEITEELEKDFFKTLSSLKNKDPKIYDGQFNFFDNEPIDPTLKKKKKKEEPVFLKDYERKLLIEKGGHISDSEDETLRAPSPTYIEEQTLIKDNLKNALKTVDEDHGDDWGGMFKTRTKTTKEAQKEETDYKKWLLGQKKDLGDESIETELTPLKKYWNDPKLDDGEKFLRDYILNKKFLDNDNSDHIPTYEEIVHDSDEGLSEDEKHVDTQEEFEHKYNYRFEEPDQDFIKRYPRTMENSLRRTDDKRKVKRAEVKERKIIEKQQKMEDLKQLQIMKKKEIEEKLIKLREITGNTEVAFEDKDFDDDFDPDAHDKRMQKLFDDEFYHGPEDEQKPEFPEIDEELEIERWDKYDGENVDGGETIPHCEDDNFNMDCDYDPSVSTQDELIENSKGKKKRKRKSKFALAVSEPKPIFNPDNKTYEQYLDEYYKLDCEDIVANIPCRFKYRKVVPNSFGLTVEEILNANDRELNRWCSIKKAIQHRPDHIEKYDQIAFKKKGENESLKRKLLPSLYAKESTVADDVPGTSDYKEPEVKKKRNRRKKAKQEVTLEKPVKQSSDNLAETNTIFEAISSNTEIGSEESLSNVPIKKKTKKKSTATNNEKTDEITPKATSNDTNTDDILNIKVSNKKKKLKKGSILVNQVESTKINDQTTKKDTVVSKTSDKKGIKRKYPENGKKGNKKSKNKFNKSSSSDANPLGLSDARLQAFGIKPKKFKNKLKYGKEKV